MSDIHSGYIAIVGSANAGKSTLLNSLIRQKISIVSPKPQTTRDSIVGVLTEGDYQMIFVDTPGTIKATSGLNEYMAKSIEKSVVDVNCILVVIDGHMGISQGDIDLLNKYIAKDVPVVAVITKTDISQHNTLMPQMAKLNSVDKLDAVFAVSAKRNNNIDQLKEYLKKFLTDDVMYFEADDVTDKSQRFLVCELIREKMLLLLDAEIPHGVAVRINEMIYKEDTNSYNIDADIIIEKASHKPIVLGKGGAMIKQIGSYSREAIEKMLGCHIYLTLWVRVKEDWRNSQFIMREVGYDIKDN